MTLSEEFQQALLECFKEQRAQGLCNPARMEALTEKYGAADAVRGLIAKGRTSDGFETLQAAGRLELSPEALVTGQKFGALFTDEEADFCLQALLDAGYYG